MQVLIRTPATFMAVALLMAGCGGTRDVTVDPFGAGADDDTLSSCEPVDGGDTTMLVEASGERPPLATMEEAVADNPDAQFMVEELEAEGRSREDALHAMYAQVVGQRLFADATQLPGYVTGAYARPLKDEPFQLSFSGPVPEDLDPDAYDLDSFGLEVTTGAAGLDQEAMADAVEAAGEVGMRTVVAYGDEATGTARIEVLHATPEQIAAWERAVEDPSRWCLVRAARSVPCDDSVIARAEERAARQGEVLPNQQANELPAAERAEEVRRSYLGLTLEASREKAAQENRTIRVVVENGVALGSTDDLNPGRLSLTVCDGIIVDARMDLEPEE
jgi:hypothetical protein